MIALGITGTPDIFHDASASLVADDEVVASAEEERFNRKKHTSGLPYEAITFCLRTAGIDISQVDAIGYYLDPDVLERTFVDEIVDAFRCSEAPIAYYRKAATSIRQIRSLLAAAFPGADKPRLEFMNHHFAHAACAYYLSGFDEAAVLTVDGAGDRETSTLYLGRGSRLTKVCDFLVYPYSLGFPYSVIAAHLGIGWIEGPGKLMALAAYGEPTQRQLSEAFHLTDDPRRPIDIDLSLFGYHVSDRGLSEAGLAALGPARPPDAPFEQRHYDIAATIQDVVERAMVHLVAAARRLLPGPRNLCLAGGVALNVLANRRILESGLFDQLFVAPPAHDGGTSLGCALALTAEARDGNAVHWSVYGGPDAERDFDVEAELAAFGRRIRWRRLSDDDLLMTAAELLARHRLVGWMQGRMELGPRALGNRSLLANPTRPDAKHIVNARVKHREWFRPYAAAVLAEHAQEWFDLDISPYMLLSATVHSAKRALVPGIVHVDGSCRLQTVTREQNERFHRLIEAFYQRTGVPMVLNTSLNRHGEPIVNSPTDAVRMLLDTDMDALFIGNVQVVKRSRIMALGSSC